MSGSIFRDLISRALTAVVCMTCVLVCFSVRGHAQREVLHYNHFPESGLSTHLSASGDTLFVIGINKAGLHCKQINSSSGAEIGSWITPLGITEEQATSTTIRGYMQARIIVAFTPNNELFLIDYSNGAIRVSINGVMRWCHTQSRSAIFVLTSKGNIRRVSLSTHPTITEIDSVVPYFSDPPLPRLMSAGDNVVYEPGVMHGERPFVVINGARRTIPRTYYWIANQYCISFLKNGMMRTWDMLTNREATIRFDTTGCCLSHLEFFVVPEGPALIVFDGRRSVSSVRCFNLEDGKELHGLEYPGPTNMMHRPNHHEQAMGAVQFQSSEPVVVRYVPGYGLIDDAHDGFNLVSNSRCGGTRQFRVRTKWGLISVRDTLGNDLYTVGSKNTLPLQPTKVDGKFYLASYDSVTTTLRMLFDANRYPHAEIQPHFRSNIDRAWLRHTIFDKQARKCTWYCVLTGRRLAQTSFPKTNSHHNDLLPRFNPSRVVIDSLGVLFYQNERMGSMFTQGPNDTCFIGGTYNGGYHLMLFPVGSPFAYLPGHHYAAQYSRETGRPTLRIDGLLRVQEGFGMSGCTLYNNSRFVMSAHWGEVAIFDPTTSTLIERRPIWSMPTNPVIEYSSPAGDGVIIKSATCNQRIFVQQETVVNIDTNVSPVGWMLNGTFMVIHEPENISRFRLRSIFTSEYLDFETGNATSFALFNNDSSIAFFGPDSVVIYHHPFRHNSNWGFTHVQEGARQLTTPARSLSVVCERGVTPKFPLENALPESPANVTVVDMQGRTVMALQGIAIWWDKTTTIHTDTLHPGTYAVAVTQDGKVVGRVLLQVQ